MTGVHKQFLCSLEHYKFAYFSESFSEYASKSYIDCSSSCESGNACPADESLEDVDGGWSEWGECSLECGGGVQYRACTNPPPSGPNGADCQGETEQACNTQGCPVAGTYQFSHSCIELHCIFCLSLTTLQSMMNAKLSKQRF